MAKLYKNDTEIFTPGKHGDIPEDKLATAIKISIRRMPKCSDHGGRTWESWSLTIEGTPAQAWLDTTWGHWVYIQLLNLDCYKVAVWEYEEKLGDVCTHIQMRFIRGRQRKITKREMILHNALERCNKLAFFSESDKTATTETPVPAHEMTKRLFNILHITQNALMDFAEEK